MQLQELNNNIESERYILGTIVNRNELMINVVQRLTVEDFYRQCHQYIYAAMLELYKSNIKFDITILANKLNKYIKAGAITLTELDEIQSYESKPTFESHIDIVKKSSNIRRLKKTCNNILSLDNTKEIIEQLQNTIDEVLNNNNSESEKLVSMRDLLFDTLDQIEETMIRGDKPLGTSTGFKQLDKATNGLVKGEYWIVGARPSMGKTAFVTKILSSLEKNVKALFVQLDMAKTGVGQRFLSSNSMLGNGAVARGRLSEGELIKLMDTCNYLSEKNNVFSYLKDGVTILDIRNKAKEMKIKYGLDVIVIDHIGLITPIKKGHSAENEIKEISKQLKALARELNITVIALSQLNRGVEQRADKRPLLSDLRESGSLEQDADIVGFLYRDGYYRAREEREEIFEDILEFNIQKNRNGRTGLITFDYNLNTQVITECFGR